MDQRYASAIALARTNGTTAIVETLEQDTARRSRVVISRDSNEVYRLACSDRQTYATFYSLVEAGFRLPTGSKWDAIRPAVDGMLFPYYQNEIRFGAFTLDDSGLVHYGDCHMILKTSMVDFRTTAFTENTAAFVMKNGSVTLGHRAAWHGRGRLAVAKLAPVVTSSTTTAELPAILKADSSTPDDDIFVEAHVYGSISIRTVELISLTATRARSVRLPAFRESLKRVGVPLVTLVK